VRKTGLTRLNRRGAEAVHVHDPFKPQYPGEGLAFPDFSGLFETTLKAFSQGSVTALKDFVASWRPDHNRTRESRDWQR
jgi:hypothetical protein